MKKQDLIDAVGMIDDDLIESAEELRRTVPSSKPSYLRGFVTAACICIAVGAAFFFANYITNLPGLNPHGTDTDTETTDTADEGVYLDTHAVEQLSPSNETIGYFCHDDRVYLQYVLINDEAVIGELIGKTVNVFSSERPWSYLGELCGNVVCEVYTVDGYPEEFLLAAKIGGNYFAFICDNDITIKTGREIFEYRLDVSSNLEAVSICFPDIGVWYNLDNSVLYSVKNFIESLSNAPACKLSDIPLNELTHEASLELMLHGKINVSISLFNGKYVRFEGHQLGNVMIETDSTVYDSFMTFLMSSTFNPNEFAELIPNEGATVQFWHKVFTNNIYLYFCTSRYDPTQLLVYYTRDHGKTIGTLDVTIPDSYEYDSLMPVYAGGGGGSGECEFIVKLTDGDEIGYISFNNFSYTDSTDILDFEYGGTVNAERMTELRASHPDNFHISELMEHDPKLTDSSPYGIYIHEGIGIKLVAEVTSDMTYAQLLTALGIDSGKNMAHGDIANVKFNVAAGDMCDLDANYFLHTSGGDITLDKSDVISIFTYANIPMASEPLFVTDEFGDSITATVHTYGGRIMEVTAEAYDLKVDGKYVQLSPSDNLRLIITTLPNGHISSRKDVYVPLTATLNALGYTVTKQNGTIIAEGSLDCTTAPISYRSELPDSIEYVLSVGEQSIFVNGKTCEYKGRALTTILAGSHQVTMYSYNDIYMYNGEYYIQPEFLAEMLDMDTDYISEFYTRDTGGNE